jgi:hypothetical protein
VLACQRLRPSAFRPRLQLYLNPNAKHPLWGNPFGCDLIKRIDGVLVKKPGRSFQNLMGMDASWPDI